MKNSFLIITNLIIVSFLNAQTISFMQPIGSPIIANSGSLRGIISADFNNDGKKDFLVGTAYYYQLSVFLGNGSGQFTTAPGSPISTSDGPIYSAVADFNNDGKLDVATANYNTSNISIYIGNGTGSFTLASTPAYSTGSSPYSIDSKDFNMDGNMDLVTVSVGTAKAYVFLGNGNGAFTPAIGSPYSTGGWPYHVNAGLFNNDNIPDFAVANGSSGNISVFLGTGTGSFTPAPSSPYTVGSEPRSFSAKDVNNDSHIDFIVANGSGNTVSVLLGQANGSFTNAPSSPILAGTYPYQTTIADYNSDGQMDFAVTNGASSGSGNNLRVFLGNGTGSFTEATNSPISLIDGPQPICSDDFNGDGKTDLVIGTFASNNVTIFINNNPVGVVELHQVNPLSIYPNPSTESMIIKLNELKDGMEFLLYNNIGEKVDSLTITEKETLYLRKNLSKGLYNFNILYKKEVIGSGKVVFE